MRGINRAKTLIGSERGRELRAFPAGACLAPHEIPNPAASVATTLVRSAGMLQRAALNPRSLAMSRARLAGAAAAPPCPGAAGRLYQARMPCKLEMPALPCGMGVCTEFKSPTLKFMKLLAGAEGCMGCMEG